MHFSLYPLQANFDTFRADNLRRFLMNMLKFWRNDSTDVGMKIRQHAAEVAQGKLGTYIVEKEIARGSMGIVYLGKDPARGRQVAIKTMTLADEFNARALADADERFVREAKILTWLAHPDIVTIYDVGEENGIAYIVMELIEGVELAEYAKPDKLLPLPKILDIMARTADALGYAHGLNVVHRDVKPANIMYDMAGNTVKLMDFGISRLTNQSMTRRGLVLGTPLYMSPEQVMGKPITGLSDLFSLGSTFYQLVSGRLPFEGTSDLDVMRRIVHNPHTDICVFNPGLPPAVCAVINQALQKDMAARFQSGAEMAEAIRRAQPI